MRPSSFHLVYHDHLARYGDIFDRLGLEQIEAWGMRILIVIFGITLMITFVFIGLWKFYGGNAETRVEDKRTK